MKRISYILLFFYGSITTITFSQNRAIEFNHDAWLTVLAKAKKENKMIYIDCYTSWCGPCKWMAKNIFTNDTAADFYNTHFINAKIDMEKGEGLEIAKKYDVRAYPTMLYLNADGEQIHRTCGSTSLDVFVESGKNALNPEKQLSSVTKNFYAKKPDAAFAYSYLSMLENACMSYSKELGVYFSTQKESDLISSANWKIIYQYVDDCSSKEFIFLETNKTAFSKLYSNDSVESKINNVYKSGLYSAIQNNDSLTYTILKTKLRNAKTSEAEQLIQGADIALYKQKKDWKNYATTAIAYADTYLKGNANELNSFAWTFYEHITEKKALEKAASWAKQAVAIEPTYAIYDTYASVLYKLGNKAEAKKTAEKAIELAKQSNEDFKETQELLTKINALK